MKNKIEKCENWNKGLCRYCSRYPCKDMFEGRLNLLLSAKSNGEK